MKIRDSTYPEVEECVRKWFVQCREQNLPDYKADDVFNADKTGLFFQCFPNKTVAFKGEECHDGKQSELRVIVLLAANQSDKEKLPPLMLGRSKKPRYFAKIKSFPMMKFWMTSEMFGD
ncbi:Tigger transposable element-derived protein 6 [Araneus ventricosus]|uniref:Tigger transposable element-derived protein 6 n=1 Tax=Araneus ventricosus TaxID=182803 RepID=A0A4Y2GNE1_ARAVE|nr:Tigger transposable element-derived protein 6 [Araneus ventricosus]